MPHTRPEVASKRLLRFRARAAELRRIASGAERQRRAMLLDQAQMFERIVEAAERDSQEPGFGDVRRDTDR
jgi:hypothetical protein